MINSNFATLQKNDREILGIVEKNQEQLFSIKKLQNTQLYNQEKLQTGQDDIKNNQGTMLANQEDIRKNQLGMMAVQNQQHQQLLGLSQEQIKHLSSLGKGLDKVLQGQNETRVEFFYETGSLNGLELSGTSDARFLIVDLVMSILKLFMFIFSPTTLTSVTKLRFIRLF